MIIQLLCESLAAFHGQPAVELDPLREAHAIHAGHADRHVRAEDFRAGHHLGHQLVRPVGVRFILGT